MRPRIENMADTNIQNMHIFLNTCFKNALEIRFDNGVANVDYEDGKTKTYIMSFKEVE